MAKSNARTPDAYFAALEGERRKDLSALREVIRKTLPKAHENMRYGMPTYEIDGRDEPICSLASQKNYMSLYICETDALDDAREAFAHLDVGKSCIRFRRLEQLPIAKVKTVLRAAAKR